MPNPIRELREEQLRIATNARARVDEITDDTPEERAAEIEAEFDRMMADHDRLAARIERMERLEAAEAQLAEGDRRPPRGADGQQRGVEDPDNPPSYDAVFARMVREGVADMTREERAILQRGQVQFGTEQRAQSTTTTAGGYTIPEGFSGEIDRALAAWGPMWDADIVRELTTSGGNRIPWPTVDDTGNTGRIKAENASVDDDGTDDVVFGQKQLDAYVYDTGMVRVPLELLQDSAFDMESLLDDLFAERLGRLANQVLTDGDGSSKPNGIVSASGLGKTAASSSAITADEIIDLLHSVDPAYRMSPKCRFMMSDATLQAVRKLKDGQGNYLWQVGDVRSSEPAMLLGKPYSINQAMAAPGTTSGGGDKVMLFGDFGRYIVRKVAGFQMVTLRERYAESFEVGMVGFKRFDGELLNSSAVKHLITA